MIKKVSSNRILRILEKEVNINHRVEAVVLYGWPKEDIEQYSKTTIFGIKRKYRWLTPTEYDFHYVIYNKREPIAYMRGYNHGSYLSKVGSAGPYMQMYTISQKTDDIIKALPEIEQLLTLKHKALLARLKELEKDLTFSIVNGIPAEVAPMEYVERLVKGM